MQVAELDTRLSTVVELTRQSRSSQNLLATAAAYVPGKSKASRAAARPPPLTATGGSSDENAGVGGGCGVGSPMRGLEDVTNALGGGEGGGGGHDELAEGSPRRASRLSRAFGGGKQRSGSTLAVGSSADEVVVPAAAPPAGKSSKLKRIPGMFRSKPKAEVSLPTCDEFTDFSAAAPVGVAAAVAGVEPTPIARRTRGANRHA